MSETDMAEVQDSITTTRSQARLIARSYVGAHRLSPRQASRGTGVQFAIRRRLLVGSAAVNSLMSTISPDRSAGCLCGTAEETIEHFLLDCDIYDDLRENLLDIEAPGECGCKGGHPCLERYCDLDDLGKCVFLLGGPVGSLAPCGGVDACLDSLNKMWGVASHPPGKYCTHLTTPITTPSRPGWFCNLCTQLCRLRTLHLLGIK